jgi:hypothetical protein
MQGSLGRTVRRVGERALGRRSPGTVAGGGLALAGGAALAGGTGPVARAQGQGSAQIEPRAGTWPTWVLSAGNQLRLQAPPGSVETNAELARLEATMAGRDQAGLGRVTYSEIGEARIAGGIHVRSDQTAGEATGRAVAGLILERSAPRT